MKSIFRSRKKRKPEDVAVVVRTIGAHTFHLEWVPPRRPSDSFSATWKSFFRSLALPLPSLERSTQRLTKLLRDLDDCFTGRKRARVRRLEREAGLMVSESRISAWRRCRWWQWWVLDSAVCGAGLLTWLGLPRTPAMGIWFFLLAGGLPWLVAATVIAGVFLMALPAYVPLALYKGR